MGVAIPHLITDLGITALAAQWLTTAFMLTMAVVIPITGFLLQRFTTRQVFIAAMGLFSLGTLIAFLSPGFPMLLVARVVQASGTAIMMPLLMTTLMTLVPRALPRPHDGPRQHRHLARAGDRPDHVGAAARLRRLALDLRHRAADRARRARRRRPLDPQPRRADHAPRSTCLSIILSALGFGGIVFGLSQLGGGAAHGDSAADAAAADALSTVDAGRLARRRRRSRSGCSSGVSCSCRSTDARCSTSASSARRTSRSRSRRWDCCRSRSSARSPSCRSTCRACSRCPRSTTGLVVLPGALAMGLAGPFIGRIYDRWGTRVLLIPGSIIASARAVVLHDLRRVHARSGSIAVAQTVLSIGLALSFTPLFTASLGSLQPRFYSYGSAVVGTVQQVAGAAGIALMITIMAVGHRGRGRRAVRPRPPPAPQGAQAAFLIAAIVSLPLIVGAFLIRKPADQQGPAPIGH